MLGVHKTGARDRAIFVAFAAGQTLVELAVQFGLKQTRLRAILTAERHRIAVSPEPEYCELRGKFEPALWTGRIRQLPESQCSTK